MTSLSPGASRKVPISHPPRSFRPAELGGPGLRWRAGNPLGRALVSLFLGVARRLILWEQRLKDREALRRLPDHLLRDIGVHRAEIEAETRKPFWRA